MLLTEAVSMEKNFKKLLTQQNENENGASVRDAALEAMKAGDGSVDEESSMNSHVVSNASTPDSQSSTSFEMEITNTEVPLLSPPTPRGYKRKSSSGIQYLEKKLQSETQLEEKRLRLEQEKLQFEKEKFEIEKQKFEVEKHERMEAIKQLQQDREFQRQRDQQQLDLMNYILIMLKKERQ